jgi:hypothetical protein
MRRKIYTRGYLKTLIFPKSFLSNGLRLDAFHVEYFLLIYVLKEFLYKNVRNFYKFYNLQLNQEIDHNVEYRTFYTNLLLETFYKFF